MNKTLPELNSIFIITCLNCSKLIKISDKRVSLISSNDWIVSLIHPKLASQLQTQIVIEEDAGHFLIKKAILNTVQSCLIFLNICWNQQYVINTISEYSSIGFIISHLNKRKKSRLYLYKRRLFTQRVVLFNGFSGELKPNPCTS